MIRDHTWWKFLFSCLYLLRIWQTQAPSNISSLPQIRSHRVLVTRGILCVVHHSIPGHPGMDIQAAALVFRLWTRRWWGYWIPNPLGSCIFQARAISHMIWRGNLLLGRPAYLEYTGKWVGGSESFRWAFPESLRLPWHWVRNALCPLSIKWVSGHQIGSYAYFS